MQDNGTPDRRLKIAIAQIEARHGDIDANLAKHLEMIAAARDGGADMVVFPELSLTGYCVGDQSLGLAMPRDHAVIARLAEASQGLWVVAGFIEEGVAAQLHNSLAVLRDGAVAFLHRKLNLATFGKLEEGKHYASGRFVDTHALDDDWRAGLLICADLWNPALTHLAFLHGATLLVTPISSGVEAVGADFDNPGGWALTMRFYSMMYGAPSIMVNRTGVEKDLTFWGGSRIIDAFGREVAVAGTEPELITAELDYDQVRKARHLLPTVRDSNISLVHRETSRLIGQLGVPDLVRDDR